MGWEEKLLKRIEKTSNEFIDVKEIEIGRVVSVSPLQIMLGDLPLFKNNLYINEQLLAHTRGHSAVTGSPHAVVGGVIEFEGFLFVDNLVALRRINDQKYILLCKVVRGW